MRILITGDAGFIGSHVAALLPIFLPASIFANGARETTSGTASC